MSRIPFTVDIDHGRKDRTTREAASKQAARPATSGDPGGSIRPTLFILGVLTLAFEVLHLLRLV